MVRVITTFFVSLGALLGVASGHGAAATGHAHAAAAGLRAAADGDRGETIAGSSGELRQRPRPPEAESVLLVLLGIWLCCFSPIFIWNSERISLKQAKMRLHTERWGLHVDDCNVKPLQSMDGRIVCVSGAVSCKQKLADAKFPEVRSEGKIKLRRIVEMYQWVEHTHGGEVSVPGVGDVEVVDRKYTKAWRDSPQAVLHDPDKVNPKMPFLSTSRYSLVDDDEGRAERGESDNDRGSGDECAEADHPNVKLGAYYLSGYVIKELRNWKPKDDMTPEMVARCKPDKGCEDLVKGQPVFKDGWWYFNSYGAMAGGAHCRVGDTRVRFEELHAGPLTVCAVLVRDASGWTFLPLPRKHDEPCDCFAGDRQQCHPTCVMHVEELHYPDPAGDKHCEDLLNSRPVEVPRYEGKALRQMASVQKFTEYRLENDMDDLVCSGICCKPPLVRLIRWLGFKHELLAVEEKHSTLSEVIAKHGSVMIQHIYVARLLGFTLLFVGTLCVLMPVMRIFHYTVIGGLPTFLFMALLCSSSGFLFIVSSAWVVQRTALSCVGFMMAFLCAAAFIFGVEETAHAIHAPIQQLRR